MLNEKLVLDHGFVGLVDIWGSDERIIESARMSTNKGFLGWDPTTEHPGDAKLLAYLYRNKHMTPFEMCGATFDVMAPILVFREWMRHRTLSYNELSARYTPIPNVNYVPAVERVFPNSMGNKQAGSVAEFNQREALTWLGGLSEVYEQLETIYQQALQAGVPKEIARVVIPVGRYSKMRVSGNLRNWMQFLHLRMDTAAQWEIRQYANAVHHILSLWFPRTLKLFNEDFGEI